MIKRNDYIPIKKTDISVKNEPNINSPLQKYPDMYTVYEKFSKFFHIPKENFILTNGGENAARIVALFLKLYLNEKKICIEDPSWKLFDVICQSFKMKTQMIPYKYDHREKEFNLDTEQLSNFTWLYTTDIYNNLFKHINISRNNLIIDETYTLRHLKNKNRQYNNIIIGSFSKIAGCGLRLGYIIFNKNYTDYFNLLREQYLNYQAVEYINNLEICKFRYNNITYNSDEEICSHPVYKTFLGITKNPDYKSFQITDIDNDNRIYDFYRVGNNFI